MCNAGGVAVTAPRGWFGRAGMARAGALGAVLLLAAGCGGLGADSGAPTPVAATPADPVLAFAARAAPGMEETVVLPGTGRAVRLRVTRAYAAASGRECREVLVVGGGADRTRLICGEPVLGWSEARPLLRGGTGRP
jgi:hypothetical protein